MKLSVCDSCGREIFTKQEMETDEYNCTEPSIRIVIPALEIKEHPSDIGHLSDWNYKDEVDVCNKCALELKKYLNKMLHRKKKTLIRG